MSCPILPKFISFSMALAVQVLKYEYYVAKNLHIWKNGQLLSDFWGQRVENGHIVKLGLTLINVLMQ